MSSLATPGTNALSERPARMSSGERWTLVFILVVAGVARFWGLGARSLWLDEVFTIGFSKGTPRDLVVSTMHDRGPLPVGYIFEWLILRTGLSDWKVRLPSAIFGTLGVGAMFLLGRAVLGSVRGGLLSAFFLAGFAFHHYYSQEARPYSLFIASTLFATWLLCRALENGSPKRWLLFLGVCLPILFIVYFSVFWVAAGFFFAIHWLWRNPMRISNAERKKQIGWLVGVTGALAFAFALWLAASYQYFKGYGGGIRPPIPASTLAIFPFLTLWDFLSSDWILFPVFYFLVILAAIALLRGHPISARFDLPGAPARDEPADAPSPFRAVPIFYAVGIMLLIPLAFFATKANHFVHPRFLIGALPYLILLVVQGLGAAHGALLQKGWPRAAQWSLLVVMAVAVVTQSRKAISLHSQEKQNWRAACQFMVNNGTEFDLYVGGLNATFICMEYYFYKAGAQRTILNDVLNLDRLEEVCAQPNRIWYATAYYRSDEFGPLFYDYLDKNFRLVQNYEGLEGDVMVFERPPRSR